jgi:ketosteroid isomerase-like protein
MSNPVVDSWLEQFVATALARDLDAHMAMISQKVMVFGVPGFDTLGYADWYSQCAHEFPQGLISALEYSRVKPRTASGDSILFKSLETTRTSDGGTLAQAVEMLLQREGDDWKLTQLRMLPEDEARHDGLL